MLIEDVKSLHGLVDYLENKRKNLLTAAPFDQKVRETVVAIDSWLDTIGKLCGTPLGKVETKIEKEEGNFMICSFENELPVGTLLYSVPVTQIFIKPTTKKKLVEINQKAQLKRDRSPAKFVQEQVKAK